MALWLSSWGGVEERNQAMKDLTQYRGHRFDRVVSSLIQIGDEEMEDCRIFLRQLDPLTFRFSKGTAECLSKVFGLHQYILVDLGSRVSKHVESRLLEKRGTHRRSLCSLRLLPRKDRHPPPWDLSPQAAVLWANYTVYMPHVLVN